MNIRAITLGAMLLLSACTAEENPIYRQKADTAMKAASYNDAVKAYETSVNEKYHSYLFYEMRGDIAEKYNQYGEAINDYTRSLNIKNSESVDMKRAIDYYRIQYYDDADYAFTALLTYSVKNKGQIYAWRAKARIALGKYNDALDDLKKAVELSGDTPEIYTLLTEAYLKLGNMDKAMTYCVKSVDALPNNPEVYVLRAKIFYKSKDANQAINDYKKALTLKPDYVEAQYNLAWIYATCPAEMYKDPATAVAMAQKLVEKDNSSTNAILLAAAYAAQGDFDKAASMLKDKALTEKDLVLQDDMRVYVKMYQEKRTLNGW